MMTYFGRLRLTVGTGVLLTLVLLIALALLSGRPLGDYFDHGFWTFIVRWIHVVAAIVWIGFLFYFNFVQIPSMPKIPDEQRPAIGKVIAPAALFWFRWSAKVTMLFGLLLAWMSGYIGDALILGVGSGSHRDTVIGIGIWLGLILWANVWFVIWPNQKKALGLVEASPEIRDRAARRSVIAARVGLILILPTIYCMVAAQNAA